MKLYQELQRGRGRRGPLAGQENTCFREMFLSSWYVFDPESPSRHSLHSSRSSIYSLSSRTWSSLSLLFLRWIQSSSKPAVGTKNALSPSCMTWPLSRHLEETQRGVSSPQGSNQPWMIHNQAAFNMLLPLRQCSSVWSHFLILHETKDKIINTINNKKNFLSSLAHCCSCWLWNIS